MTTLRVLVTLSLVTTPMRRVRSLRFLVGCGIVRLPSSYLVLPYALSLCLLILQFLLAEDRLDPGDVFLDLLELARCP